jgi:RimJ/RimL family protein N-acetyltransferase
MTNPATSFTYPYPPLRDSLVRLRRWRMTDLECVREASQDREIPEGTSVPAEFTERDGVAWIDRQWGRAERGEGLSLAVTEPGTDDAVGGAVLLVRRGWMAPGAERSSGTASVGYWMLERARGRGLASRAVALLAPWALRAAGFERVEALVEPHNVASQRVLERAGFQREGLLRSYLVFAGRRADGFMYSLLPSDLNGQPAA